MDNPPPTRDASVAGRITVEPAMGHRLYLDRGQASLLALGDGLFISHELLVALLTCLIGQVRGLDPAALVAWARRGSFLTTTAASGVGALAAVLACSSHGLELHCRDTQSVFPANTR